MGAVEGLNQINTGELLSLSEQQLLDCNPEGYGCGDGGLMTQAFEYIQQNSEGIMTEDEYSYRAYKGQCQASDSPESVTINGYEYVPQYDENALMQAVSQQPVSVGIDAKSYEFSYYNGGIFNGNCGQQMNHAVTLIGYGTDSDGTDYWILKNSWGEDWGENGFMRIIRGQNQCGITNYCSYPV